MKKLVLTLALVILASNMVAWKTVIKRPNLKATTSDPRVGRIAADPNSNFSTPVERACADQISQGKPMLVQQGNDSFLCMPMLQTGGGYATILSIMQKGPWENYRIFDIVVEIHSQGNLPYGNQTFAVLANRYTELKLFPGTYTYTVTNRMFGGVLETGTFKVDGVPGNSFSHMMNAPVDFVRSTH